MTLSTNAQQLLEQLRYRHASNLAAVRASLEFTEAEFNSAREELIGYRLAKLVGRGGRIEATAPAQLLKALPVDGSSAGNYGLRSQLELDDKTYAEAKRELLDQGLITVGRGYGGSIARANVTQVETRPSGARLVRLEKDLYEPFAEWLKSSLEDQDLAFAEARITATPRGWRLGRGRWSRPDVTAVQVSSYTWVPQINVEVSSYEIKRAADATKLESVYEAAAHGRWAHRASLVVETPEGPDSVPERISSEVIRMGLGLYTMTIRPEGGFDVHQVIKPPLTLESQPEDLDDLIGIFLGEDQELRQRYLRAIGR